MSKAVVLSASEASYLADTLEKYRSMKTQQPGGCSRDFGQEEYDEQLIAKLKGKKNEQSS